MQALALAGSKSAHGHARQLHRHPVVLRAQRVRHVAANVGVLAVVEWNQVPVPVVGVLPRGAPGSPEICIKAWCNALGRFFLRFSARRRMPRQAVALKKYRCGTLPDSKMSDNEHTAASLGQSEVLSVQDSVGPPIPELCQPSEEGAKVPSS